MSIVKRVARFGTVCALLTAVVPSVGPIQRAWASAIDVPQNQPTIQAALDAAVPGDVIVVSPGTYNENIDFHGKDVTLQSSGGPGVTSIASNGSFSSTVVQIGPGGKLMGFTVTGGTAAFGSGMSVNGSGTVVEGNVFSGNTESSGGFGAAIGGNGASPTIERNLFKGNSCDDQYLSGVVAFVNESSPYIANNVFQDNACRAIDMTLPIPSAPIVINNTIVRNPVGIHVDARIATDLQVYRNNIVFGNAIGLEEVFGSPGNNPTFDHNLVAGNTTDYSGIADQTGINGNISANPLFKSYAASDFHLLPGSPAIDAGSVLNAPADDFDGTPRELDGSTDIGAFEASGPPPADLPGTGACTTRLTGRLGNVNATGGTTCLDGATVTGVITVQRGASLSLVNSTVSGALVSQGGGALTICHSTFYGPVLVNGARGFVLIGDGGDGSLPCTGNTILGVVVLGWTGAAGANTGGVEFAGNTVAGPVIALNNQAPSNGIPSEDKSTELEANHIRGALLCVANSPGPVNDGKANSVTVIRYGQCAGL